MADRHPAFKRTSPRPEERTNAMSDFSLKMNEDQIQLEKWVHDFAEDVMRPQAEEWDEKEEFPWSFVAEAAEIGLYG